MSSLESKAKTPEEIMRSAKMPHGFKEKWIPLKESQKEISAMKVEFEKNNAFAHNKILELSAKIVEANKILDLADFEDLTGAHKIHWSNWQALRESLSQEEKENK